MAELIKFERLVGITEQASRAEIAYGGVTRDTFPDNFTNKLSTYSSATNLSYQMALDLLPKSAKNHIKFTKIIS